MRFILSFVGSAIALFLTAEIVNGVTIIDLRALIIATIIVGLVNTFIRPILRLISLPITLVTFGLFAIVVNAITFSLAAWITPGFEINGIIPALLGAIVLSITSTIIDFVVDKLHKKENKKED